MTRRFVEKLCTKEDCVNLLAPRFARSPDSRESFQGTPFFANRASGGLKIANHRFANHRFEAIRESPARSENRVFFPGIDSRELIHANRLDSRCESPGHPRPSVLTSLGA